MTYYRILERYLKGGRHLLARANSIWGRFPTDVTSQLTLVGSTKPRWLDPQIHELNNYGQYFIGLASTWAAEWLTCTCPVFRLSPKLSASLVLTEAPGVPLSEIRLPFKSILFQLPDSPFRFHEGETTRSYDLVGVREIQTTFDENGLPLAASNSEARDLFRVGAFEAGKKRLAERLPPTQRGLSFCLFSSNSDMVGMHVTTAMDPDTDVETWLKDKARWDANNLASNLAQGRQRLDPETTAELQRVFPKTEIERFRYDTYQRLVVNFCLYLDTLSQLQARRPTKKERKQKAPGRVYDLGREVKLPTVIVQTAKAYFNAGVKPSAWKLRKRFLVRGHWRNQPYGPGRKLRKRIRIEPFWRGPETAEEMERIYRAETLEEAGLTDA